MNVTIKDAIHQHSAIVEDLISSHIIWCPRILDIVATTAELDKRTLLRLNDGRECQVVTRIAEFENGLRIETGVSKWEMREKTW